VIGPGLTNGQTVRGRVFLIAQVNAPAPVVSVTFQLDNQPLTTLTSAPYRFDWDSTTAPPGLHNLIIKAMDAVGNQGQNTVQVNVVLPPVAVVTATPVKAVATQQAQASRPNPVVTFRDAALPVVGKVAGGLAILVAAVIALVLWLITRRSQRQVQVKLATVEITNQGNSRSRYELRAEDPRGMLKFEFMLNDTDLAQRAGEPVPAGSGAPATAAAGAAPARYGPPHPDEVQDGSGNKVKETWNKATEVERKAVRTVDYSSTITTWLVTITYLLPGSVGESLRASMSGVFNTQYQVRNVVDAPGRYQRAIAASAPPPMGGNPNAPLNTGNQYAVAWPKTSGNGANAQAAQPRPVARSGWSLTPPIDAGDTLAIQLRIRPARFPRSQHYDFVVLSRSVDGTQEAPLTEHGSVALRGGPIVRRILGWLFLAATLVLLAVLAWYVLMSFRLIP
jgi:hypothetical protein